MDPRKTKEDSASQRDDNPNANSDPESDASPDAGAPQEDSSSSSSIAWSSSSSLTSTSSSDHGFNTSHPNTTEATEAAAARARRLNPNLNRPTFESTRDQSGQSSQNVQRGSCREQSTSQGYRYLTTDSNGITKGIGRTAPLHIPGNVLLVPLGGSLPQNSPARSTRRRHPAGNSGFVQMPPLRPEDLELESPGGDDPNGSGEGQEEEKEENGERRLRCNGCRKGCKDCREFPQKR